MAKPLAGIKVIELANFIAGPLCGTLLADMGADVIKVEPPKGDMARATPPIRNGESVSFVALNRNKRSLVLDLKRPEAAEILLKLAVQSDVFVEAYRPGALDKLGLGGAQVKAVNPRIIYTSVSGFGQSGPYRRRAGVNLIIEAFSGMLSVTGEPGKMPMRPGVQTADVFGALFATYATLAGLVGAGRTGEGFVADVSLVEPAVCAWNSNEIEAVLMTAGVPCACVNNFKQVFDDPHIVARGVVKDVEHPRLGHMRAVRNPILFDHDGPTIDRSAPMLGEHSEEILHQLGYSADAVAGFIAAGVTRNAKPKAAVQAAE